MHKLNLGCGRNILEDYVNLDITTKYGANIAANIEEKLPFANDSFDEVLAENVLCQVSGPKSYLNLMNELWRVTKRGGDIIVRVPLVTHPCAFQDPFDVMHFTPESFTYMQQGHRRYDQYGVLYGFKPFYVKIVDDNGAQMVANLSPVK